MESLLSTDAEYLLRYIKIQDSFINAQVNVGDANRKLVELNEEFSGKVSKRVLKKGINSGPVYDDDSWMPSDIC